MFAADGNTRTHLPATNSHSSRCRFLIMESTKDFFLDLWNLPSRYSNKTPNPFLMTATVYPSIPAHTVIGTKYSRSSPLSPDDQVSPDQLAYAFVSHAPSHEHALTVDNHAYSRTHNYQGDGLTPHETPYQRLTQIQNKYSLSDQTDHPDHTAYVHGDFA